MNMLYLLYNVIENKTFSYIELSINISKNIIINFILNTLNNK